MPERLAKKVLLIGWDAADWKVITPLLDAGHMPALQGLVERGVMGNIATLDPPLSPMLWTSIATGHSAVEHGVLGFVQPNETGDRLVPVLGSNRKVKALWNILSQECLRTNIISWWPSHPADAVNGVIVSNFYHRASHPIWESWPVQSGTIHPAELTGLLAALRVHPAELTTAHIAPFAPFVAEKGLKELDEADERALKALARIIADAASTHAAATWLMEHTEWDFTAVYLDAIDHFSHAFMKFHPPRLPQIEEGMFERWRHAIEAGYRFHDMILDRLLTLAGPDTTVLLLSDHGFHSDHLRPRALPKEPASAAYEHRDYGIFCLAGPGIRADERVYGATLFDIAPTVLTLFGLPVGDDMRGRPLAEAFETPPQIERIPTWEAVAGEHGMHANAGAADPWTQRIAEDEAMRQLVELGYIDEVPAGEGRRAAIEGSTRESQYYLARAYKHTGRIEEAAQIFADLVKAAPEQDRFALRLADCYRELGLYDQARKVLGAYEDRLKARMAAAGKERPTPGLDIQLGLIALAEGNTDAAITQLEKAAEADPHFPDLHRRIGGGYLKAKRWSDAERAFHRAFEIDADNAGVLRGLALATLRQDRYAEAADYALQAVSLRYSFPAAHAHLGEALMRLGHFERAAEAFEVAVAQQPGMRRIHVWLAELYRTQLDDPVRATAHLQFATDCIDAPAG